MCPRPSCAKLGLDNFVSGKNLKPDMKAGGDIVSLQTFLLFMWKQPKIINKVKVAKTKILQNFLTHNHLVKYWKANTVTTFGP